MIIKRIDIIKKSYFKAQ